MYWGETMKQINYTYTDCHPSRIIDLPPTELPETSTPDTSDIDSRVNFPAPIAPPSTDDLPEPHND